MTTTPSSKSGQELLATMAQIPVIIPGTLSPRKDSKGKVNGWKLQRWHHGQNQTRYIPAEQVDVVRQGTAGCRQFMAMAEQYVEAKGQETLDTLATPAGSKKKPMKR